MLVNWNVKKIVKYSEVIDKQVLTKIRDSRIFSIMVGEGTDINYHQNLSIFIRYCNQDKDAQTIFDMIVKELQSHVKVNIDIIIQFD